MFLSPKIDEVRVAICNANLDFVCIKETWLKNHIDDNFVLVPGYNIIRRDRVTSDHGGICMYVRDSIRYDVLSDFMDENFEVLWVKIRPKRLPRGIPSIIVRTVYHPPNAIDSRLLDFKLPVRVTIKNRSHFSWLWPLSFGGFQQVKLLSFQERFRSSSNCPFSNSWVDLVFTNLSAFYDVPKKLPPFGLSDHDTVEVQPLARRDGARNKILLKSIDLPTKNRLAMRTYLDEVDFGRLVGCKESCEEITLALETIIKTGLDFVLPLKSKTIIANEPPWISKQLKSSIHERQIATEGLRDCEPRRCWKEVKSLRGMQSATRTDPTSVLKHIDSGPDSSRTALANVINNAFLAPMNSFTPLDPGISVAAQYTDTPTVAEFCVLKKLIALNPAKASGPDGVPAWLLKENADLLAPVVTDILNCSYLEARLPQSWKLANVAPIPKQTPVYDVNKHLRPISLTPVLSKLAEDFVVDRYLKPALLAKVDSRQVGTVPGSSTTEALISNI